jgi:hypothetical protein
VQVIESEAIALKVLEDKHLIQKGMATSEQIRRDQALIINRHFTKAVWEEFKSRYTEDQMKKHFFNSTTEYLIFVKSIQDYGLALKTIRNNTNPHFIAKEDVDNYFNAKESTLEDHYPGIASSKNRIGTAQSEFMIDRILVRNGDKIEYTAQGLQSIAYDNGSFITIRNCKIILPEINKQVKLNKFYTADKSGLVTMKEEYRKKVVAICAKNNIPIEMAHAYIIQGEKAIVNLQPALATMFAKGITETDIEGRTRIFLKLVKKLGEVLAVQVEPLGLAIGKDDSA